MGYSGPCGKRQSVVAVSMATAVNSRQPIAMWVGRGMRDGEGDM